MPSSAPPPEPVFFVDRNLGKQFPEILRAAGVGVEIHDEHFPEDQKPPDDVWLRLTAERGWIALSQDARIRYTSRSKDTIAETGARLIIVKGKARNTALGANFVRTLPKIRRFIQKNPAPWIAKLYRDPDDSAKPGRIELWVGGEQEG